MMDQVIIGEKYSFDDFEASMKERTISQPKKKSIKETVPFSNKTYDFTSINGEPYWEDRELEYVFEITADSPEELEEKKMKFLKWIMFVENEELHDPFISDFHFLATFNAIDTDDSEIEKTTISVTFTAYPYLIANNQTQFVNSLQANETRDVVLFNDSAHKISPTIIATAPFTVTKGSTSYAIAEGKTNDETFELEAGKNTVTIQNIGEETGVLTFRFSAEVM